jgi:hypothetical protein
LKTINIKALFKIFLLTAVLSIGSGPVFSQYLDSNGLKLKTDSLTTASNIKLNSLKQVPYKDKHKVNFIKFGAVTGVTAGAFWWLHNYQKNAWWSGQRGKFHFQNDWDYAMSADKLGHFFDGAFIQALYQGAMEWSGFSPTASQWIGALFSIAYMTDIEIEDGFATDWGFSMGDQIGNVAGALYPVAQYYWKPLRSFNFKWSYYPSQGIIDGTKNGAFLDDYNGQTMWLSMSVHDALPKKAKKFWPDFLNIAVGYGVNDYTNYDKRYADYYVGLDLDWTKIIPGKSKFMMWFKNVINHFRFLPLPAINISEKGVKYTVNF